MPAAPPHAHEPAASSEHFGPGPDAPPVGAHDGIPERTLRDLDFARILHRLAEHARTTLGQRLARVPRVFRDRERVVQEIELTSEVRGLLGSGRPPPFGGLTDIGPILAHASKHGVLEAPDLIQVADALRGMWLLRCFLFGTRDDAPGIHAIGQAIPDVRHVFEPLYDTFNDDGTIRDDASAELKELRARRRSLHERIHERIRDLLRDTAVRAHLQDEYFTIREDRYVLPVRAGERGEVEGIIHGSSQTGQTLYIEPAELVGTNNELKLCEQAVLLEEHRILAGLTQLVGRHGDEIRTGLDVAAELDVVTARAHLAGEMDAHAPSIPEDAHVSLQGARNPHLLLRGVRVVPNDVDLGSSGTDPGLRMLVLTGPNAGGKTVILSTVGLCAVMVRAGLHIPAGPDSRVPVFRKILTLVGDSQDIQADLSTFSGHLVRVQRILDEVGEETLVLLDELAVGTAPSQGAALAVAVAEAMVERGALGIVTTHYERLKTLSLEDGRFRNGAVGLDERSHEPNYRLTMGMPGSSSALEMAARLGLCPEVVERAAELLGDRGRGLERVLRNLDEERARLERERERLSAQRARLERETTAVEAERARIREHGDALVREAREEALEEIARIRRRMALIIRDLQREPDNRTVQKRRVQVVEAERTLRADAAPGPPEADDHPPLDHHDAVVGREVWVPAFQQEGTIAEVRGAKAVVAVGSIRTTVGIGSLRLPKPVKKQAFERREPVHVGEAELPPKVPENTCDVRGERVEDAVEKIERFLDAALLSHRAAVFVLHGHGTGRLRTGIRKALLGSQYVERIEPAPPDKGGEAITVVWLR